MALEPITRQEQIVAGKELEPITRMERFLKDYGVSNYFGETTVKGDTLTWDGNTDGLANIGGMFFKVSDAVLSYEDFAGGFQYENSDGVESGDQSNILSFSGINASVGNFYSVSGNAVGVDLGEGFIAPESGIYFSENMVSLTIPGYNGFETTTIKPIETKYLPEHLHFGEETKVVNEPLNITWDGNTEGLVSDTSGNFYKVSDLVLSDEQMALATATINTVGSSGGDTAKGLTDVTEDATAIMDAVICIRKNAVTFWGTVFPEKGLYFYNNGQLCTNSLTTTEPVEQTKTVVKPLAEQYMPTLTSPSGKKFKLSVDDSGVLSATEV